MASLFKKAVKDQAKLRLALIGPSGSGKTYSALAIACELARLIGLAATPPRPGRVGVIDTECGSARLYAKTFDFDVMDLSTHSPLAYVEAIHTAEAEGFDVIVTDSLSHAWIGKDGALEQVDKAADRDPRGNSFTAWRSVTPKHTKLVDTMVSCKTHLIVTIRAKTEFVQEKNKVTGKTEIVKLGLAPIQRDGLEYEFTLVGDIDLSNTLKISKTRLDGVVMPGDVFERPGVTLATKIYGWLMDGAVPVVAAKSEPTPAAAPVNAFTPPIPPPAPVEDPAITPAEVERVLTPIVERTEAAQVPPPAPSILTTSLDAVFAKYLEAIGKATDQVSLDNAATGPGKPMKGTPLHALAADAYKARKAWIAEQAKQVAA